MPMTTVKPAKHSYVCLADKGIRLTYNTVNTIRLTIRVPVYISLLGRPI